MVPSPTSWLAGRGRFAAALAGCLVLAALLRPFPAQFKFRHGGDSVRYLTWSKLIAKEGVGAFPSLLREYRQRWVGFPPPTRSVYLLLAAGITRVWKSPGDEFHPLVLISWLSGVLSLLPVAFWLRRAGHPEVALIALVLLATSPVMRAVSHFPLPDSLQFFLNLWILGLVARWLEEPRRWVLAALALCSLAMVLVRETGLFGLFGAAGMVVLDWVDHKRLRWAPLWAMFAGCVGALVITLAIAGGFGAFWDFVVGDVKAATTTSGALPYVSGPPYTYLVSFMIVAPAILITVFAAVGPLWRSARMSGLIRPVVVSTFVIFAVHSFFSKSLRYMLTVEAGMRIIAAAAVWASWQRSRRLGIALLVTLLALDVAIHGGLFLFDQVYDPTVWAMARQLGMIP